MRSTIKVTSALHSSVKSQGEQGKEADRCRFCATTVRAKFKILRDNVLLLKKAMLLHQHFLYALTHNTAFSIFSVLLYHTTSYDMFFVIIGMLPSFFLIIHWHFFNASSQ